MAQGVRGASQHTFAEVPRADIPRSSFRRNANWKGTFDAGWLVPFFVDEVLPGDTLNLRASLFGRLATPIHPIMDNLYAETFFFFVPNRLVWTNWVKMMGQQDDPGDSVDFLVPQIVSTASTGYDEMSVYDFMGIPTKIPELSHSALPLRMGNLIWNEWFRDQNIQDSLTVPMDDGPDDPALYEIQRRGKRHDYFTSSLPWPQKGPAVDLPLGSQAPVLGIGTGISPTYSDVATRETGAVQGTKSVASSATSSIHIVQDPSQAGFPFVYADLSSATAATINQLRQAFQIQKLYERDARGGTRYTEILRSHFGVVSPDARLQRPEFLGGGSTPVNVTPIAQTSETTEASPQGNLAAQGTLQASGHGFTKSFTEHGFVIGYMCVRGDVNYQQGLDRMWSRRTKFDFFWPALAHLGEQAVLNKEIYAQGSLDNTDDEVFGYQEAWAEMRYKSSQITGLFRSNAAQSLDTWHVAQEFSALPTLSPTFIVENPAVDRVIAVPSQPQFLMDCYMEIKSARPMPLYSVPGLIDHF